MNAASLALAERSAPRYTSYPTSPHFSKEIGDETTREWLAGAQPRRKKLSLYFHVPFCREICAFCGCHTKALRQDAPLTSYKETLLRAQECLHSAAPTTVWSSRRELAPARPALPPVQHCNCNQ